MSMLHVAPVGPTDADALAALLSEEAGCYCRYWLFQGDKNAWLEQCGMRPEENASQLRAECTGDKSPGLIARTEGKAVGWMRISPMGQLRKLTQHGTYKRLQLVDEGAWAVACVYVQESARKAGVHRALVDALPAFAASVGATALYAFPRPLAPGLSEHSHDSALMMGAHSTYLRAGFVRVAGDDAYPVLRLDVRV